MPFSKEILHGSSGQSTGFYNGVVSTSAMFNDGDSDHLSFTPSSANEQTKGTVAAWVKRSSFGSASAKEDVIFNAGSASGHRAHFRFYEDHIRFDMYNGSSWYIELISTGYYRDTAQWYHCCAAFDTTDGLAKIWVNGVEVPLGTSTTDNSSTATPFGDDVEHAIGERTYDTDGYFDGYIADAYFLNGIDTDYTAFAEFKNGVLIPKKYSGSFGTNGFHLEFKNTGTGTASSSTVGADTSGNNNHFTSAGHPAGAQPDCPEKNMPTWNILVNRRNGNTATFYDGNKTVAGHSSQVAHTSSTIASKGKHYAEFYIANASKTVTGCGVVRQHWDFGMGDSYASNYGGAFYSTNGTRNFNAGSDSQTAPGSDRVGIEVDFAANEVQFFICESDGTKTAAGAKLTSSNGIALDGEGVFTATTHDVSSSYITAYFNESEWYCTPSDGYVELSSTNSIDDDDLVLGAHTDEQPNDHFNTILYTGNGSGSRAISGVGFQPDLLWVKSRSSTYYNGLWDSNRTNKAALYTNVTDNEDTGTSGTIGSLDSDGFTTPNVATGGFININTVTYVAWNWKANGGTTTSNDASATGIGSIDSVHQANTKSGFSIVTWTGTGTAGTIAHGLGKVPKFYTVKNRTDDGTNFQTFSEYAVGTSFTAANDSETDYLYLNSTASVDDADDWNDTGPTSTVFSVKTHNQVNASGDEYLAYLFAEVEGFSKFGFYEGTGSASNSPFIYTGFKPALVVCKSRGTENWIVVDIERPGYNPTGNYIYWNLNNAEGGTGATDEYINLLSNGFKLRTTGASANSSGQIYIYLAFAENPFKYNNAR